MMIVRGGARASPPLRSGRARSSHFLISILGFDQAKRDHRRKHQRTELVQDLDLLPSKYLEPTNGDGYAKASQEQVPIIDFLHPTITTSNFG